MNATTILIRGTALLLTGMHSLIGYAQTDDGSNENASGGDSILSAGQAQGAIKRFDIGFTHIELPLINQASIEAKFTRIFASHHHVVVVAPLIDSDIDSGNGFRGGDLEIGYSFTPKQKLNANPWVPSNAGSGIGLWIPTGDLDDGTGTGSWRLAPRLGFVSKIGRNLVVVPALQYIFSFAEETGAEEIRLLGLAAQILYVGPRAFWIQWTPEYAYNFKVDDGAFSTVFRVGKLFTPHFAVSIDYARVPVFKLVGGGTTSDHANVWTLGLHFPFNYGE